MKRQIAQILLSAFLVFHVFAIFILPNPESILFREVERVIVPYGTFLGINTTWRFFSPNPQIRILEYEVLEDDGSSDGTIHRYPVSVKYEGSRESYNRQLNHSMYMMANQEHLRDFLTPILCQRHPGAHSLVFYSVSREFPTVEGALTNNRDHLERLIKTRVGEAECPQ